jgi:signal transduction histidine kinase
MTNENRTDLYARLVELCDEFRAHGDIGCEVALDATHTRFDAVVSERELLSNARRHAKATVVKVSSVDRRDGSIGIMVADDGIGLPPHRRRGNPLGESGTGLWNIDQRLRGLDAVLDIDATTGHGTSAMVILPGDLVVGS